MTPDAEILVFRVAGACIVLFGAWFTAVSVAWDRYSPLVYCFGPALLREQLDAPGQPLPPVGSLFFSEVGEYKVISPTEIRGRYARQSRYELGVGTVRMCWAAGGIAVEGRMNPAWPVFLALTLSTALATVAFAVTFISPAITYPVAWLIIFAGLLAGLRLAAKQQAKRLARDYIDGLVLPGPWSRKAALQFEEPDDVPAVRLRRKAGPQPPRVPEYEDPFSDADE